MKRIFLVIFLVLFFNPPVFAEESVEDGGETGLNLPRMVSLRSNLINARSGPGARYPIEWVYMQKGAPVEITAEFELWRKIKDWQGSESWVHKSMLSSNRSIKVTALGENNIYQKPDSSSRIIGKAEDEVVGEVKKCPENSNFCLIKFDIIEGWVSKNAIFGVYPKEVL